jgi:hypothetical protein
VLVKAPRFDMAIPTEENNNNKKRRCKTGKKHEQSINLLLSLSGSLKKDSLQKRPKKREERITHSHGLIAYNDDDK